MDIEAVNNSHLIIMPAFFKHTLLFGKSADEWIVKDFAKYVRTDGTISVMTYGDPLVSASFRFKTEADIFIR